MSALGIRFISSLLHGGSMDPLLKAGDVTHLFTGAEDDKLFGYVDGFVRKHGKLPALSTFHEDTGLDLPPVPEPCGYYLDRLRDLFVDRSIRDAAEQASQILNGAEKKPIAALDLLIDRLSAIKTHSMAGHVIDYRTVGTMLETAYRNQWGPEATTIKFGWPSLDNMAGGITVGDIVSFVGAPARGKTWLMLWAAMSAWQQGKVPLFASMEIKPLPIFQRLSAMHSHLPIGEIKLGMLDMFGKDKWMSYCQTLSHFDHPFWVIDGNLSATVKDLHSLAVQLKPDIIFIDGAYLLGHPTERNRFVRVAENTDLIKKMLADIAPTVCSWQFNREARKMKKGETPGLEHIGYSDAIGQVSSLVLALLEDESIETEMRRKITVLKGRNGEMAEFSVKWEFESSTDFSEVDEADAKADLEF